MDICKLITKDDLGEPYVLLTDFLSLEEIVKIHDEFKGQTINFKCENFEDETFDRASAIIGKSKALKMMKVFSRLQIHFPALRIACKEKIIQLILQDFNGYNYSELAKKYDYTERHIRKIITTNIKNKK